MFPNLDIKPVRRIDSIKKAAYTAYTDWMDKTAMASD
jgi:hypothetical protein